MNYVIGATKENYQIIFYQYFYDHRTPTLEYLQKDDSLYFRWSNVVSGFAMPIDIDLNGIEKRLYPTKLLKSIEISPHSVVHIRDWESLIITRKNPDLLSK